MALGAVGILLIVFGLLLPSSDWWRWLSIGCLGGGLGLCVEALFLVRRGDPLGDRSPLE